MLVLKEAEMKLAKVLIPIFIFNANCFAQDKGVLVVKVNGLRNDNAKVNVLLHKEEDGFPGNPAKAWKCKIVGIPKQPDEKTFSCEVTFPEIPFGWYAISVLHDEDEDKEMDRAFFGMGFPKEGYGVSNIDNCSIINLPNFKKCKFLFNSHHKTVDIKMHY